jgi:hypothetical protein
LAKHSSPSGLNKVGDQAIDAEHNMARDDKVVDFPVSGEGDFPISAEERARRLRVEVERLARLPTVEWMFYVESGGVAEKYGIERAKLKAMIEATIRTDEKKAREGKAEDQRREQRAEKQQTAARREQKRQEREQQRLQQKADKEAEKRGRERAKEFAAILKLPKAEHEARLAMLAKRSGEDLDFLRDEFAEFSAVEEKASDTSYVEPWPEPVDTRALLTEVMTQFRRYVVVHDDAAAVVITLWICFAWCHEVATHSPILEFLGADADTGKTTACGVVGFLTPRARTAAELTGPSFFHLIDHLHPTLIIDDADQLLQRRPDLAHLINVSWSRGTKIPRQWHGSTRWYDVFTPKVLAGVNLQLPKTTATRTIVIRLLPKLPHEKIAKFRHVDDDHFITLRRKLARWSADNMATLAEADPIMPPHFSNRLEMNYEVLFAIADLAGGDWPKKARAAATKLTRKRGEPSQGKRLLAAMRDLFAKHGPLLTSKQVQQLLTADDEREWANYSHGPITKWQIAQLLKQYDIAPDVIHPRGRPADRGYGQASFETAFKHYLDLAEAPARGRTVVRKPRRKRRK